MNVFEQITASPEELAEFLRRLPVINSPWDEAFHRLYCDKCSAENCDICDHPERDNPLWYLSLAAEITK